LIEKCSLHFDDFVACLPENPYLKHFFGYLESVSLGKKLGEVVDKTRMNVPVMKETAGQEIKLFVGSLPDDEVLVKADRKRKTAPKSSIDMFKNDEIADLKNDELKVFLKSQGERLTGRKHDLVDRVHRCIEKELFK
jgi:hypothetical protein